MVWHLRYPTDTEDQRNIARHHLSLLRDDPNVVQVEAAEDADTPNVLHLRVTFVTRCGRPDRTELQALDQMYGVTSRQDQLIAFVRASRGEGERKTWYERILDED